MQPTVDFRGYLNTVGGSDPYAKSLLGYVGGDYMGSGTAGINMDKVGYDQTAGRGLSAISGRDVAGDLSNYYQQYQTAMGGGSSGAASTGPTAAQKQQFMDFTNRSYDTKLGGLQGIYDTLNPQQDAATLNVNNQWQNQSNALESQRAIGTRNLNMAGEQVEASKVKSLADLQRQVQGMGMGYNMQLGGYGAADSSASDQIQRALSGMASKNRANVVGSASQQQNQIGLQKNDLEMEFENNRKSLDDWKTGALTEIATKFMQQRQQIQQQMTTANAERYQALASLDQNYVNQAIQALGNLQTQYQQSSQDLIKQYQNITAPNAGISQNLQQFAVNPISAGKISQLSMAPAASQGNQPTAANYRRPFDQDYGFGLGS